MRWLFACVAAAAFVGVTVEAGARYEGFGKPLLYRPGASGYELVPNQRVNRLGHISTINNIGTRGRNVSPIPAPGTFRAMVLGDSVANGGTMLNDDQTFAAVASKQLAGQGCKNEILNAAAGGWSLFDEIAWVKEHGLHGAQMVIWTINYMDLDQIESLPSTIDSNPSFPSKEPPLAIWEIARRYVMPRMGIGPSNADTGSSGAGAFHSGDAPRVLDAVRGFKTYLDQRGVKLMVIYHEGIEPAGGERLKARLRLLQELAAMQVNVIETDLAQDPDKTGLFIDRIHPNTRGHARIGSDLGNALTASCHQPLTSGAT